MIYNTKYNFQFNHESPGHANLYITEKWPNGINHFVNNNFEKFIERYNQRIENFRNYLTNNNEIIFALTIYNHVPIELDNILHERYPNLKYKIGCITKRMVNNYELHFKFMEFKEDDPEYIRNVSKEKLNLNYNINNIYLLE